jgi:rod shape determining protein RodA
MVGALQRWHLDKSLFSALLLLAGLSLLVLYSASGEDLGVVFRHFLRLLLGFGIMLVVAQIRAETISRWSPWIFAGGTVLLLAVMAFGTVFKGAQRWLTIGGFSFQPSEMMKLAVPMMLAWYFAHVNLPPKLRHVAMGAIFMAIPAGLIAEQPDLGTAMLVTAAGGSVLFLAGMGWRTIVALLATIAAAIPIAWSHLHDYQRNRVLALLDPQADPLGTGYHTLQAMIAVGSGGFFGKGWLNSTQAHLQFLPESSTDFVFAVFAEEFGLIGIMLLLSLYLFIVVRGLLIAFYAQTTFNRLLAGGLSLVFFVYIFVNTGMVSGILPVVGVPLPLLSYGGTSIITLMTAFGMIMSIQTHRKLVL